MSLLILMCSWIYLGIWIETLVIVTYFESRWISSKLFPYSVLHWNSRGMQSKAVNELTLKLSKAFSTCHQTINVTSYLRTVQKGLLYCFPLYMFHLKGKSAAKWKINTKKMFSLKKALNMKSYLGVRLLIATHSHNFYQSLLISFIWPQNWSFQSQK